MAYRNIIDYEMAAAMILGANIGTTVDAALAAIGTKTVARQTALVHVLFNVIGTLWALVFFRPLLGLVSWACPGSVEVSVTAHLALFHTVFNVLNTLLFFPFVQPFATLVRFLVKDKEALAKEPAHYKLEYKSGSIQDTPELNILRAEKEIRDMAEIAASMYTRISEALASPLDEPRRLAQVAALVEELRRKEGYVDEMREELTRFFIECTHHQISRDSHAKISRLLRIIANLEEMTDDCCAVGFILERGVKKNLVFKRKEMAALSPYMSLVEGFLSLVQEALGAPLSPEQIHLALELEEKIDASRNRLRKLGRKRLESGHDVKTELLFMDLVRYIEKMGDYCYNISRLYPVMGKRKSNAS
jgi:phosphate:Na+ symporter